MHPHLPLKFYTNPATGSVCLTIHTCIILATHHWSNPLITCFAPPPPPNTQPGYDQELQTCGTHRVSHSHLPVHPYCVLCPIKLTAYRHQMLAYVVMASMMHLAQMTMSWQLQWLQQHSRDEMTTFQLCIRSSKPQVNTLIRYISWN